MNSAILTIGDEILIGQITDTNSAYISRLLNALGIKVNNMLSISDSRQSIVRALDALFEHVDLAIITGGLGPTKDDITKHVLAEYFNSKKMVTHEPTLLHVQEMCRKRGFEMVESNRLQAQVPEVCEALFNEQGTAPGMWFDKNGKVAVSLPGVPFEMEGLMQKQVISRLQKRFALSRIVHQTLLTYGIAESKLSEVIASWEDALPPYLRLAYLPTPSGVKLRLSCYETASENEIPEQFEALKKFIPDFIVGMGDYLLEDFVGQMLKQQGKTVSTAESCTGGRIASMLTSIAGSSAYFKGSVVSYANDVKVNVLGVNAYDIVRYGAVSQTVAEQMARGVQRLVKTDYAMATSGIAGPGGGTPEKPVGTVWVAVATPSGVQSQMFSLGTADRERNIACASANALNMLRKALAE
ncbi:MAG: CinA family nicotinamide mononucleotide deamidase-related protein [Prevotellaceae bacterium]|jgi:nicotinamide-nucleotide amidase|nr:CinA family nicotinamide mononucleotide deamidase-related protein [Prevotellaceae bacterium]